MVAFQPSQCTVTNCRFTGLDSDFHSKASRHDHTSEQPQSAAVTANMCGEPMKVLTWSPYVRCSTNEPTKVVTRRLGETHLADAPMKLTIVATEPWFLFPSDILAAVQPDATKQDKAPESPVNDSPTGFCGDGACDEHIETEDRESASSSKSEQCVDAFTLQPVNKGSRGHPDFCARPCLYFHAGTCVNGTSCEFCHCDHEKHLVHLDKRNRSSLSKLPFAERVELILPIIAERAQLLSLTKSLESIAHLKQLVDDRDILQVQTSATADRKITSRESKKLKQMLRCLRVQELVRRLNPQEAPPSVQLSIAVLAFQLQDEGTESVECRPQPKTIG